MSQELKAYLAALQASARQQEADVAALQSSVDEVTRARQLLARLPDKVRHKAMVPFGKHAFFPGELVHTNEFLVGLGCDLRLEASAKEAAEVLARRQARAEAALAPARRQLEDLRGRVSELAATLSNEEGEALVDIREDYEESEELLRSARSSVPRPPPPPPGAEMREGSSSAATGASSTPAGAGAGAAAAALAGRGEDPGDVRSGNSSGASQPTAAGELGEEDRRIFARLAELERLEAEEAGSSNGDGDSDEEGTGKGGSSLLEGAIGAAGSTAAVVSGLETARIAAKGRAQGPESASPLAKPPAAAAAGPPSAGPRPAGLDVGSGSVAATVASSAGKAKAGSELKKGFFLGGGSGSKGGGGGGGRSAAQAARMSAPEQHGVVLQGSTDGGGSSSARGGAGTAGSTGNQGQPPTQRPQAGSAAQGAGGDGASGGGASGSARGHARRVSFADEVEAGRVELSGRSGEGKESGEGGGVAGIRPALKQGSGQVLSGLREAAADQGGLAGSRGGGPLQAAAARVAVLEDGGDASMAMARAREEAFTGLVRERKVDVLGEVADKAVGNGVGGGVLAAAPGSAASPQEGEGAAPKRTSKFKQQRMGAA